jgi:predicted XRE-type DNA-binding protein
MLKSKRYKKVKRAVIKVGSDNIFKELGFADDEAVNMFARGQLALEIRAIIEKQGWSQRQAASEIGVAQPRIAEIMKMKIEHYSVDQLIKYLDKLGWRVSFRLERKHHVA